MCSSFNVFTDHQFNNKDTTHSLGSWKNWCDKYYSIKKNASILSFKATYIFYLLWNLSCDTQMCYNLYDNSLISIV